MINIIIDKQGRPSKSSIFLGNQHENLDEILHFLFPGDYDGYYKYVTYYYRDRRTGNELTGISPLVDGSFIITSAITKCAGMWEIHTICKSSPIDLEAKVIDLTMNNSDKEHIFISDVINGRIGGNNIDIEAFENVAIDENIASLYDSILALKNKVEENDKVHGENEDARKANELERQESETARKESESERVSAEQLRIEAEIIRNANETKRQSNESARITAESLRDAAESARASAENQRVENEKLYVQAERTRVNAEKERMQAETLRKQLEATRQEDEAVRQENESARVEVEKARVNAENARVQAETLRSRTETARGTAENERDEAERIRQSAEASRAAAESKRADTENSRINTESQRVNAESSRVSAESKRVETEKARVNVESQRVTAESSRTSAEVKRVDAEKARANAESQRTATESSRVSAESNRSSAERQRAEAETSRINAEQSRSNAEKLRVSADAKRTTDTATALKTLEDAVASEREKYSQQFFENYFALQRTGKVYTVKFPKWSTSQTSAGEKLDDNKGLICEPSTRTIKGHDDYESIPLFRTFDVNAYVDDDGVRHVSAIKGDHNYRDVGEVDVFVLGMSYYERHYEDDKYWYYSRTDMPKEGFTIARECINKDGSIQPFGLYGKYVAGLINKKPYSSKGLMPMRYYSGSTSEFGFNSVANSFFDMPQTMAKKGKYYSGGMTCDYKYIATSFWLKFPTLNFQSVMSGCTGYSGQFTASMQYSDNRTYFPLSKSNAESIKVGSYVSVGYKAKSGNSLSNDRAFSTMHAYADDVKVLRKEDIDDSNVAVYLDVETGFNTMPVSVTDTLSSDIMISTMHWHSGYSDDILGRDGAPCDSKEELTNGIYPACIQGIECFVGGYETYANAFMNILDTNHREVYITNDATLINTNATTMMNTFKKSKYTMSVTTPSQWNYITKVDLDLENGAFIQSEAGQSGSSSATGYADAVYFDNGTSGQREFLAFGALYYWSYAGLFCCVGYNGLPSAYWGFLARLSLNGVGGELTTM